MKLAIASVLLAEFMGNEDLDDDGEIYGKTFKIDPTDDNRPLMLKEIEDHPKLTATVTMTWADYLASL